ncbi:LysR family transcriptional regulator [Comamonas sp. NoAH]|uniref:LysR family transcriptional regulator n=1 Tax=Comamonas halotolerans TaxID=3041496 RepID=UPI0024E18F83|nr:LysR family transcriptional regulator [Comamonas sp. NoAH]
MDLRALRYFVEVVRANSFTRAAETVHVTQPTISKMVKQLEDELGGPLLLREGRGVQLTDAGQVVYERGLQLLAQAKLLRQEVAEVDGIARGELSVGIMPTAGHYMAPVIALFQQRYPGVTLHVQESGARAQRQLVHEGKLDMALGLFNAPDAQLQTYTITHQKTRVVMAKSRVTNEHAPVQWRDLAALPFLLYTNDFALHEAVLERCAEVGFTPQVRLQSRYWDFIGDLVAADIGVAVMFEHVIAKYDPQRVASRPLIGPEMGWDVMLMWRPGHLSRAAQAWLDCVREVYPRPLSRSAGTTA